MAQGLRYLAVHPEVPAPTAGGSKPLIHKLQIQWNSPLASMTTGTAVIYRAFPHKEAREHDVQQELGTQRAEAFVRAFLKRTIPHLSQQDCERHLQRKAVVLEYFTHQKPKQKKKSKGLSSKQRRDLRLFDISPEQQRYSLFLPLHELWKQYIRDLCNGLKPDTQPQMIQAKLLKADLHGAIISVIPKLNCVFTIEIDGFISYIYGSNFQLRSSERSAKKFKVKGTIDL
ncbi:Ribonuclease P protein subunit p29 [Microtus ochrogaster]|uniref:Ribonuclease P protein subunit p29 n=1 Tax=Microtus ochrogaster TaxID=79684 RepID=A0A8J6KYK3_MICOH|nr:Ribonuclease P protein subunit p29 [Microtus ochrogaster]